MTQTLTFAPKEADKAYISNKLWLPKSGIRVDAVKKYLEFVVPGGPNGEQTLLRLWEESTYHLICPREFIPATDYPKYKFPFVDLRPTFQSVPFQDLVIPRNLEQQTAWDNGLAKNKNGIFVLACGKGKTMLAIKKIATEKTPTLVVVPDGGILSQWQESIMGGEKSGKSPGIKFDGNLGLISGGVFDWAHPLTLALVTTLWMRIQDGTVPEQMFRYFGLVVYDEVHRIGAPKFSLTAEPFYGDRIGLTATAQREDGLDPVYRYHIGEPFYSDLKQDLIPRVYFIKTPVVIDLKECKVKGQVNISRLRSLVGMDYVGNVSRYWSIRAALEKGRKILCLSHSKNQLRLLHAAFPGSSLIIGDTAKDERMDTLRSSQLCFAIAKLGSEGVDDDSLDTLAILTPFRSKNSLQQAMGRVQRSKKGKMTPVVMVFEDFNTRPLRYLCRALKTTLTEWAYPFEDLPPQEHPLTLPVDAEALYQQMKSNLPESE
jgi:superfamily II DNA or RNA helicase